MGSDATSGKWVLLPYDLVADLETRASHLQTNVPGVIYKLLDAISNLGSPMTSPRLETNRSSGLSMPTTPPNWKKTCSPIVSQCTNEVVQRNVHRRREVLTSTSSGHNVIHSFLENETLLWLVLNYLSSVDPCSLASARLVCKAWAIQGMFAIKEMRLGQRDIFAFPLPRTLSASHPQEHFFCLPTNWASMVPALRRLEIADDSGTWKYGSHKLIHGLEALTCLESLRITSLQQPLPAGQWTVHNNIPSEWRTEKLLELAGARLHRLSKLELLDSPSVLFADSVVFQPAICALQQLTALSCLSLTVSPLCVADVARAICPSLQSFAVAVYVKGDSDIMATTSGLSKIPKSCHVELNIHHLQDHTATDFLSGMNGDIITATGLNSLSHVPRLVKLGIQLEHIELNVVREGLWKGLQYQTCLQSLCLDGISIMHDEEDALETTFSNLSHLKSLTHLELPLSISDLFGETPLRPASSLKTLLSLTHLRSLSLVGQEHIPDDALANLLEPLINITSLDLSAVSSIGYSTLHALEEMTGLTHLNLVSLGDLHEFNVSTDFTKCLSQLTGLRVLDLRENPSLSLPDLIHLTTLAHLEHFGVGRYFTHALDMGTMHSRDVSKDSFYEVLLDKLEDNIDDSPERIEDDLENLCNVLPLLAGFAAHNNIITTIIQALNAGKNNADIPPPTGCSDCSTPVIGQPRHLREYEYFHCDNDSPQSHFRSKWYACRYDTP